MIGKKINQLATELAPASTDLTIIGNPTTGVSKKITLAQLGAIFSGAVSFYTNYAAFPTPGTTDVIFCAKDTQKLYLWSGSAYTEVFPSQALLNTYQLRSEKGVSNGYASLDSSGKVPISQLPSSIMEYKGTWNAATNTPTLANGTGDTGDVYICNVAGTVNFGAGPITFAVGDYVIYSGSIWQRSSGAVGTVTSVGLSITGDAIGVSNSPITTSGTLALAFAGTSGQYINGAGFLTTFPSLTGFVPYTGATGQVNLGAYDLLVQTLTIGKGNSSLANNTALGYRTLFHITTGNYNTAVGYEAAHNTTTGQYNTALGQSALFTNTTGSQNTALGLNALLNNTTGGSNVVVGLDALQHNTTGSSNTALGYNAGSHITGGSTPNTTASSSVYIGRDTKAKVDGGTNEIVIGYNAIGNGSNTATFGNTSTTANYFTGSINGGSFVKSGGTSAQFLKADGSVDSSTYVTTDTFQTISASKTFGVGFSIASAGGTNQLTSFINTNSIHSGSAGTNVFGFNNSNNIYFGKGLSNGGVITYNNSAVRFYALPDADGTIALVGGSGVGTVTSVGLSSATSGVTIGSTPITTSGTITLAIATASGSQQGLLSSTDWTTFNNKQSALTNPVTGTGTTNYLPKFTGTSTIGNSAVSDDGTTVTLNSRALTVSTSSSTAFAINSSASTAFMGMSDSSGSYVYLGSDNGTFLIQTPSGGYSTKLTLNDSGNLGLGVTPSAWGTAGDVPTAFQFGASGMLYSYKNTSSSGSHSIFGANAYFDGSGFKYINTNLATYYRQYEGTHAWLTAPSGTAGNAISFTQAMTLNASGNLSVGNTNNTYKLDVTGTGRFTSDLSLTNSFNSIFYLTNTATNGKNWNLQSYLNGEFYIGVSGVANYLTIASTGAATFSGNVFLNKSTPLLVLNDTSGSGAQIGSFSNNLNLIDNATGTKGLVISLSTGAATFSSSVTAGGNVTGNGVTIGASDVRSSSNILTLGGTSEVIRIAGSSGNVGIGTTSPLAKLHIESGTVTEMFIKSTSSGNNANVRFINDRSWGVGINMALASSAFEIYDYTAGANRLTINSSGSVGIGTTSPNGKLTLSYSSALVDGLIFSNTATNGRQWRIGDGSGAAAGVFGIYDATAAATRMVITSTGAVGFSNTIATGTPSVGSAEPWKLGSYAAGGTGTATGVIYIEVNGQIYSIPALLGTP